MTLPIEALIFDMDGTMIDSMPWHARSWVEFAHRHGITMPAEEILRRLAEKGFASGNIVFGIGSYTYQCNTRDTFGFAVKATNSVINGEEVAIFKDPKTDSKKKSAKGRLFVFQNEDGNLELVDNVIASVEAAPANMLEVIFRDGEFVKRVTLDEIRARSV